MVLVHHDAVVVLATGVSATARMLPVLADATMAGTHVPPLLPVLLQVCTARDGVEGGEGWAPLCWSGSNHPGPSVRVIYWV